MHILYIYYNILYIYSIYTKIHYAYTTYIVKIQYAHAPYTQKYTKNTLHIH